ncbi:NUDIX hydrolase [Alphaproteobacteria bacterium]|nr:NUDIX hydrolase [Alphaproteobacteria bacterium]
MTDADNLCAMLQAYAPYDDAERAEVASWLAFIRAFGGNIYTRDNVIGHVCASAFVLNQEHTKVLMAHHNIYNSFAWLGGHADGEPDLLAVAVKEAREESGLAEVRALNGGAAADISMLIVVPHVKRGKYVPSHLHLNASFLLEADEAAPLRVKEDENSALKWIELARISQEVREEHMKPVYARLVAKAAALGR